jgi:hypothetical protein
MQAQIAARGHFSDGSSGKPTIASDFSRSALMVRKILGKRPDYSLTGLGARPEHPIMYPFHDGGSERPRGWKADFREMPPLPRCPKCRSRWEIEAQQLGHAVD